MFTLKFSPFWPPLSFLFIYLQVEYTCTGLFLVFVHFFLNMVLFFKIFSYTVEHSQYISQGMASKKHVTENLFKETNVH